MNSSFMPESKEMFEAVKEMGLASGQLAAYFKDKYKLTKLQAVYLSADFISYIPDRLKANSEVEVEILELINEIKKNHG